MTFRLVLLGGALALVGCATAQEKAEQEARTRLLTEKTYMFSCEELATEAKAFYRAEGFELPSDKENDDGFFGIRIGGGGSSSTSMESSGSFSFGTGGGEAKEKPKPKSPPDVVVNTATNGDTRKRFACWEGDDGADLEMTTAVRRNDKSQVARDFEDEMKFLKRIDEDGYDAVAAEVKAAGAAAK